MTQRKETWIEGVVSKSYQPPNAARAARRQVFVFTGTALVVLAALATEEWLSWLLWGWAAYRATILLFLVAMGPRLIDARTARWECLPIVWRDYLTGKVSAAQVRQGALR